MKTKYLYFEGLRGILALIVVIHHFILLFYPKLYIGSFDLSDYKTHPYSLNLLIANTPLNIFMNGGFAVCMFFTLSGFVLSLNYLNKKEIKVLQESIAKRYIRLVIPILATCLLIYILHAAGIFKNVHYPRTPENFTFGKDLFLNDLSFFETLKMSLFNVPINGDNTYLPILWTMEVEFLGALLLFSFLFFIHHLQHKLIFYLLLFTALLLMNKNYILLFFIGSLVAQNEEILKKAVKNKLLKLILLLLALFFCGIPNIPNNAKEYTMYGFTTCFSNYIYLKFHIVSCFLFFVLLVGSEWPKKILSAKPLLFLGKISFAVYLIHLPLLFIFGTYFLNETKGNVNLILLFIICFCIILVLAQTFHILIDSKAVSLANSLVKKIIKPIKTA